MNKLITLAVLAFASTGALADDLSTDILYGGAPVSVSPSSPFVQNGPVNSELATDLVYGSDSRGQSDKAQPFERVANERQDISTDIVHGG
ncbi:hypothetical protein [Sedimenticola hydrogenitrophicus]|uniref:hypothetical protein n=1 Tax=Sedimenticola hydrogenitrophicus TaxID=2967975 RepID=UPI0023B0565A|nr:hypothetical protein [Sedimenticola hydrogenitrophicus]